MIRAYSVGTNPSPTEASVLVGLGMVAIAAVAPWYRRDLYFAFQWLLRYRERGIVYKVLQIGAPVVLALVGIVLVLAPFLAR